jgi:cytochrome c biogenesis protein
MPATGYEAPPLGPRELARWSWRQLTSMRTALILLFLLALASIPGSVVPQEDVDSLRASQWRDQHPQLTPVYERLGLFSVYDSVWFSAIYILLMISLVGCIVPRLRVYWRGVRARPPAAPRNLARLPQHRRFTTDEHPEVTLERARALLRNGHFRLSSADSSLGAERGYLREAGNLLFHLSVLVVLVGFAVGGLWGFRGGAIVVAKDGFANTLSQYDDFRAGAFFDPAELVPFDFTVNDFDVTFIREGREAGMAHKFAADLTYRESPTAQERQREISVNHPLTIDGTDVFLISHGYAPNITVRNADGSVAFSGPVVFLPEDATFRSYGVVKVPDAQQAEGNAQIGLEGEFYPTYGFIKGRNGGPFSAFPDARNPALSMLVYSGDLGIDGGEPQSVYALQNDGLDPVKDADGKPVRLDLAMGRTAALPDGLGTVTFDGLNRYVKLQVSHTPGQKIALAGVVLALVGLLGSLFIRPRRIWVRARRDGGATVVEVAGLDRSSGGDLSAEIDALADALRPPGPVPRDATQAGAAPDEDAASADAASADAREADAEPAGATPAGSGRTGSPQAGEST